MPIAIENLKNHLAPINDLSQAASLLGWDQRVYMPPQGAQARARHLGTLSKLTHEMFIAPRTGELLAAAEGEVAAGKLPADSDEAALVRVVRRDFDKATKVPTSLVVEMTRVCTLAEEVWVAARAKADYPAFAPWLEKILDLKRQYVQALGIPKGGRIYDVLLDDFEQGATSVQVDVLFADLKTHTVPLVAAIAAHADRVSDAPLRREFPEAAQEAFARKVIAECGYDFTRGRLDRTVHPFCTNFSINDVRITTRFDPHWFPAAFFGCLHEMGHGLYEMGCNAAYEGTPLAGGVSLGVHESQSRLWENYVGRSRPFWQHYYPQLKQAFPQVMGDVSSEALYQAINRVAPSFIRVEADELTYNLHIILRYEMEVELLEKRLAVADAPAAWNAKMKSYLGITPPTDSEGLLQDVHWSFGGIGYFPTYTLGNVLAAQLFAAATQAHPAIPAEIARGHFATLLTWLRTNVHQYGHKYPPDQLVPRATGRPLSTADYLAYLRTKFSAVYGL